MILSRRQRVVYTSHTGRVSGAEKILLDVLRGLDRTRYEPFVLCPVEGDLQQLLKTQGVSCTTIPTLHARFTWKLGQLLCYVVSFATVIFMTRKAIERCNPDFVHANTVRAGIVTTLATVGTGRTVVWHIHDSLPRHPLSQIIRLLAYKSVRTYIVAVSNATARTFCGSLPFKDRICVIHNGTDLSRFPLKRPEESSSFKLQLGLPKECFLVCAVGQICVRKGLRELLEAFSQIYDDVPQMHLAIVGRPVFSHEEMYGDELIAMATAAGIADRVHFTGECHNISAVLQSADLLVLNSFEEPFGLVLIEAMSSGTPVLATRVGGIPEIITDSENGWLIKSNDPAGVASKLLELSRDPESLGRVARSARNTVYPQFSLDRFLVDLHKLYATLTKLPCLEQELKAPGLLPTCHNQQGDQHV
jgi:glycosyltransferase involved in cell wall biosynthesis